VIPRGDAADQTTGGEDEDRVLADEVRAQQRSEQRGIAAGVVADVHDQVVRPLLIDGTPEAQREGRERLARRIRHLIELSIERLRLAQSFEPVRLPRAAQVERRRRRSGQGGRRQGLGERTGRAGLELDRLAASAGPEHGQGNVSRVRNGADRVEKVGEGQEDGAHRPHEHRIVLAHVGCDAVERYARFERSDRGHALSDEPFEAAGSADDVQAVAEVVEAHRELPEGARAEGKVERAVPVAEPRQQSLEADDDLLIAQARKALAQRRRGLLESFRERLHAVGGMDAPDLGEEVVEIGLPGRGAVERV